MTAFFLDLQEQIEGYQPGSFARCLVGVPRKTGGRPPRTTHPYTAAQEAADLETLSRIELQRQDYFDGMGEIHARQQQGSLQPVPRTAQ